MPTPKTASLAAICAACLVLPGLTAAPVSAAKSTTWSTPINLPVGTGTLRLLTVPDPAGGTVYFETVDGVPSLSQLETDGTLEPAQAVPAIAAEPTAAGTPLQLAFIDGGGAIVAWRIQGDSYMAYRSANGNFGTPVELDPTFMTLATNGSTVITLNSDGEQIRTMSWALNGQGDLNNTHTQHSIYDGDANVAWLTLDADGSQGEAIVEGVPNTSSHDKMSEIRLKDDDWQTPVNLSSSGSEVVDQAFAATPDGRAVTSWVEMTHEGARITAYAVVRQPGAASGAPHKLTSAHSHYEVTGRVLAAAGTDGTLAVAPSMYHYSGSGVADFSVAKSVFIAAPHSERLGHRLPVSFSFGRYRPLGSLGAGQGQAIVGWTGSKSGDGNASYPHSTMEERTAGATVVGAAGSTETKVFGFEAGIYDADSSEKCPASVCIGTAPNPVSVVGTTVNATTGTAAAVGQLNPNTASDPVRTSKRDGNDSKPKLHVTSKPLQATKKEVPVRISCVTKDCVGQIALAKVVNHKIVSVGKASYAVQFGKSRTVKVNLTMVGKMLIENAPHAKLKATLAAVVTSGKTLIKTVTIKQG